MTIEEFLKIFQDPNISEKINLDKRFRVFYDMVKPLRMIEGQKEKPEYACFNIDAHNSQGEKYYFYTLRMNERSDSWRSNGLTSEELIKKIDEEEWTAKSMTMEKMLGKFKEIYGEDQAIDIGKLYNELFSNMEGEYIMNEIEGKIVNLLDNGVKQIIFTGAPGTGKTYTAKMIAENMIEKERYSENSSTSEDDSTKLYEKYIQIVQFHPSYDYTDFVEGLRPVEINGQITFKKVDGIFKAFCRSIAERNNCLPKNLGNKYFFIIDEINRADLSKVFGELMYCLEADKRGPEHAINTQYQNLKTYDLKTNSDLKNDIFENGFYIPENVYIIGTMNDIDRSVESMDYALRRRFMWIPFEVNEDMLKNAFESRNFGKTLNDNAEAVARRVMQLNNVIKTEGEKYGLDENYFISQGQFINLPEKNSSYDMEKIEKSKEEYKSEKKLLSFVWDMRIESLLKEYLRGEGDTSTFTAQCRGALLGKSSDGSDNKGDTSTQATGDDSKNTDGANTDE